ncbi:MAG: tetratricopeptide repeat protein [Nevskiaceae bacterium]|nr:MAG: tetratricopeptide repeat protein [Nevskiaceae bacterium]
MIRRVFVALALLCGAASAWADITLDTARAEFRAMHNEEAQRQFEQLRTQAPDDPVVLHYLGRLQLRAYHRRQAVDLLRRAVALAPDIAEYRINLCEALGAYIDEVPFYRKLTLAREIHRNLLAGVAADPSVVDLHDGLMKFYLDAPLIIGGGHDQAEDEAARIAALDPVRGHVAHGVIAAHDRHYGEAEREFRAAIEAAPDRPLARYELGRVQLAQGHYDAALATYRALQQALPGETAVYYAMAEVAAQSGQRLEAGLTALNIYLARGPRTDDDPSLALAYRLLGRLSARGDRPEAAREAYRTALRLDPGDGVAAQALRQLD